MPSGLDTFQQTFCMSMIINSAGDQTGTAEELQSVLATTIEAFLAKDDFNGGESWSVVWGPVVWQAPGSQVVDQALSVCYNATVNQYHVSISATNPNSSYDIFHEDLAVSAQFMVPFPNQGPGHISAGNAAALQILLAMESGGATLSTFLKGKASTLESVVFSGHSLGGGLTPLLAYALFPGGTSGSGWNNVYTYPTAGPATADGTFAAAFNAAFPITGSGRQTLNANQYNSYDIVPNAWSGASTGPGIVKIAGSNSSSTTDMFYTNLKIGLDVLALNMMASALAKGSAPSNPYIATNYNLLFSGPRYQGQLTTLAMLGEEVLYQHTTAYAEEFGVTGLFPAGAIRAMAYPSMLLLLEGASQAGRAAAAMQVGSAAAEQPASPE